MFRFVAFTLIVLMSLGCGGQKVAKGRLKTFEVTGTITYNGNPVDGADVTFLAETANRNAFGRTNETGIYRLTTYSVNDGAVEGRHKVSVVKRSANATKKEAPIESAEYVPPGPDSADAIEKPKDLIPAKYSSPETSGLVETVDPKSNTIDIKLTD